MNKSLCILAIAGAFSCAAMAATGTSSTGKTTDKTATETRPIGFGSSASATDNKMAQTIRDELKRDATLSREAQSVSVNAANGEVVLSGKVANQMELDKVRATASRLAGDNRVNVDQVSVQ